MTCVHVGVCFLFYCESTGKVDTMVKFATITIMLIRDSAVLLILSMSLTKMYNFIWIIQLAKLSQHSQNFNLFSIEQTNFSMHLHRNV